MEATVLAIQQLYPQVFHACHVAHARQLQLTELGRRAMQSASVLDSARLGALLGTLSPRDRQRAVLGLELLARGARSLAGAGKEALR